MKGNRQHLLSLGRRSQQRTKTLFRALEEGDVATMNLMLKEGGLRINDRSEGQTLLHIAVLHGRCITVIRRLVRAGCLINSTGPTGDTALHLAVQYHRIHIAVELIRLGANVHATNNHGETVLQLAVANKSHVDLLAEMIPNGERYREQRFYGIASLRLATAAEWRPRDWIPALVSSYRGETIYSEELRRLVKILLDTGADVDATDVNGCSPIQSAVYTGDVKLVKTLIDAGADLDNQNRLGATALHDAILCGSEEMVQLLLTHGARVDIEIKNQSDTALHWAL
ncbi:putative ankyrin repeat protein RF_0381 [Nasonia vitripennis]|uniref:Ankyrin n=1 Tax=Nasonia vitripennis TaxID=7425 RepID=A0A7M7Q2P0_NASVI|nr:putative ankyrin repeat protein RF_0381 [Nasonia vitripennis]